MTNQQKEAIGFMLMAARACHMTALQEERLERAMFHAFMEYLPEDARDLYDSLNAVEPVDEYSQIELNDELTVKDVA